MTPATWIAEPYDSLAAVRLQDELGLGPAAAAILARRGHTDPAAARDFLAADTRTDPSDLPGAHEACALILRHVDAGARVLVFGDYDVDGVSSTAMMIRTLRSLGAEPAWQLPSRAEGYGLNVSAVEAIARSGVHLLITVDCGVTSVAEVARARELGMEVLVTDHHRPAGQLPECPIVHPALGPGGIESPAGELCAAGVVLKLSEALLAAAGMDPAAAEEDLDLAGLATVCDMVPLRGENRRIAREGIEALGRTRKPGLRALMRVADLEPGDLDARSAGFRLGPRINAAGRLQRADAALELLLTDDEERAEQVALELDRLNHDRRETEQRILHEAEAACRDQLAAGALVVAGEGWHAGVVGIVASRLVERFRRPAVVIALDAEGGGRGSGRSIAPYDLHAGLADADAAGLLRRFGGHRMAAGLEIDAGRVPELRRRLAAHAGAALAPQDLATVQRVDAVVSGGALTLDLAEELERLGPFGSGNPAPTLLVPAARIEHVTAMGEERKHARFSLVGGGARARGVAFQRSQRSLAALGGEPQDVAVSLERNRWKGAVEARVVLKSLAPTRPGQVREVGKGGFWDEVVAELEGDPGEWWPQLAGPPRATRMLRERHGEGLAGVTGDLLSSGGSVMLVVADIARRRVGLEISLAGIVEGGLAVCSWESLGEAPAIAEPFTHMVVVDPPPVAQGLDLLARVPGEGLVHLAWSQVETDFTIAYWRFQLDLRQQLTALWRTWGGRDGLEGTELEAVLRGDGAYPRSGALAGRLLRVLSELGLIEVDRRSRRASVVATDRTSLEHSVAFRAYARRLMAAESHLSDSHSHQVEQVS